MSALASVEDDRVSFDEFEIGELGVEYDDQEPQEVLRWGIETFAPRRLAICTSFQSDGMALLDMAWRMDPNIRVFTVDTGRLPPETYELMERVTEKYQLQIEVYYPDPKTLEPLILQHGVNLFYKSVPNRLKCCDVRKIQPLRKVLDGLDCWVTGLRRDQWATRSNIRKIELDNDHGGLVKLSPLADWTDEEVWDYIRANDVPYHSLYDQGYKSIGCAPCTRAVAPGADSRSGRWWWEKNAPKECGMHCAIETGGFEHQAEVMIGRGAPE